MIVDGAKRAFVREHQEWRWHIASAAVVCRRRMRRICGPSVCVEDGCLPAWRECRRFEFQEAHAPANGRAAVEHNPRIPPYNGAQSMARYRVLVWEFSAPNSTCLGEHIAHRMHLGVTDLYARKRQRSTGWLHAYTSRTVALRSMGKCHPGGMTT